MSVNKFSKHMVSIRLMTYNHENFIEEALKGIDIQITNFNFEVVIGDDFSSDETLSKIKNFDFINPRLKVNILNRKREDSYDLLRREKGRLYNFIDILKNSQGKYIALLDGDDYWTDPLKLQKQVDFLEENPRFVGCFHNSEERYWNDYTKASYLYNNYPKGREITLKDIAARNMVPTCSAVFKNKLSKELFTEEFLKLPVGDWPLHLLNTRAGNYYYLPQVMCVRNLHPNSVWGMQNQKENVEKLIGGFNLLIQYNWFSKEINDLFYESCVNLEKSINPLANSEISQKLHIRGGLKKRIINRIIKILKKI